ncbi:putative minor capsid protein [Salinibacillus xinjiangensis]|uniref:Minor capsid protein n=1 Tax=Salinibacillus xinjiangensis TaxID=1229268 RepID=A0A6G1X7T8_9BACI|nr:putative minor capsid protein [Salinibacillus xinjiangensis]MRG87002.1 minor capsid protein [Salinibacillus xinjiangensis]
MAIKPIPKQLLIHTIEYEEFTENNGWDDSWAPPVTIQNVRVEPISRLNRSSNSEGEQANHVVIVDRVHSSHYPEFKEKSKITFDGNSREVVEVKPFYAFGKTPHHYELGLG